ncbi:MAG: hypothetical protein CVV11_19810 [Gammaproteobacteria bacterium HGW-Gammaproteobacteria-15]|nr:MAG: hypothetical protein CVV11_19810 [Gammaproteobacteria bacterium HGW-Gammaproteobacteria-15]
MAQAVTVYRWDDPGAPQLVDGKISTFFDVIQKCLVDGYGSKAPLGWTRSYYDPTNFKAAWRNNVASGGSGGSVYFFSNTNNDANNTLTRITSCKSITAGGSITGQGRLTAIQISTAVVRWVLIGTPIGFYFYSFSATGLLALVNTTVTGRPSFYAGDIFSIVPNDAGRFIVVQDLATTGDTTSVGSNAVLGHLSALSSSALGLIRVYDADGADASYNYGYNLPPYAAAANGDASVDALIYPKLLFPLVLIPNTNPNASSNVDRNGVPMKISPTRPSYRGILPGLLGMSFSTGYNQALPVILEDGYHLLPASGGSGSLAIIQTGEWNDPFI